MIGQQAQYTTRKNKEAAPTNTGRSSPLNRTKSRLVLALIPLNATRSHQTSPINDTDTIDPNSLQHVKRAQHQTSHRQNLSSRRRRSSRIRTHEPRTNRNHHNSRQRNHTTTRRCPPRLIKSSLHKRPHNSHNSSQRSRLSRRKRHNKPTLTNSIFTSTITKQIIPRHATLSTLAPANPIRPQNQTSNSEQHNHRTTHPAKNRTQAYSADFSAGFSASTLASISLI